MKKTEFRTKRKQINEANAVEAEREIEEEFEDLYLDLEQEEQQREPDERFRN